MPGRKSEEKLGVCSSFVFRSASVNLMGGKSRQPMYEVPLSGDRQTPAPRPVQGKLMTLMSIDLV